MRFGAFGAGNSGRFLFRRPEHPRHASMSSRILLRSRFAGDLCDLLCEPGYLLARTAKIDFRFEGVELRQERIFLKL